MSEHEISKHLALQMLDSTLRDVNAIRAILNSERMLDTLAAGEQMLKQEGY